MPRRALAYWGLSILFLAALILVAVVPRAGAAPTPPTPPPNPFHRGLSVHPNELPAQAARIAAAGTAWVRLEFVMEPDGSLDLDRYDEVVDSIRASGMSVLALVDYMTIPDDLDGDGRKDYDDPEDYLAHQQRFTETVQVLANHFAGRVTHWEIWNEENGQQWHVPAAYYARLLVAASAVIKQADPDNQVLFGGLDHVWVTSQYLEPVYDALDQEWAGARPFDLLAVHPYFIVRGGRFILDPNDYLWEVADPTRTTLDKYLAYMASRGDAGVDLWITELGWNSALDDPAIDTCPAIKAWSVTRAQQAQYLRDALDILFKKVRDPQGRRDRVKTVVWYQYQDTGSTLGELAAKFSIPLDPRLHDLDTICPADWGVVDAQRHPKPAYWAFQSYRRVWTVYLPLSRK